MLSLLATLVVVDNWCDEMESSDARESANGARSHMIADYEIIFQISS
jgi:hypothetical protein